MQIETPSGARRLLEFLGSQPLEPGTIFTHDQLSEALGKPIKTNRSPLYSAIRLLEKTHQRTLVCVEGKGYRVPHPNETCAIVQQRLVRGARQFAKGSHTTRNTEVKLLTQQERQKLDQLQSGLNALKRDVHKVNARLSGVEGRVDQLESAQMTQESEIKRMIREEIRQALGTAD